ncbi:type III polyketide synthase [Streptomyces sp. TRM70350]|uniref:type III polyketide synthase n=1 Tax=Streptomyces sp. TRM70350 TaxID=2856165 RepID=UPI001C494E3E|nr:type III polyketide synthase [Streptomyces sp. TRM70350]MBV7698641.1 type III polyketide synthase [Streptomyces sp. TRM70350]
MTVLCCPAVSVPEHTITMEDTLHLAERLHSDHGQLPLALKLISNTGVRTRHLIQPLERTLRHPGVEERTKVYVREAKVRIPAVVDRALNNAGVTAADIDAIVFVSCTAFTMPSLTAWMINELGFRHDTCQIPIAQLGCAAGGAAINRAHDFCASHASSNVLIVSCEFCSLCYQPDDLEVGNLLSNGLFGDAVAAAVVKSHSAHGLRLDANGSRLVPDTEDWISYAVKDTGFHFRLDRRVPRTMEQLAPALRDVAAAHGWNASALDFYVIHAGGPRILDDLSHFLGVPSDLLSFSRATLTHRGNIASAVVLDVLRRLITSGTLRPGHRGIVAGFGPGITAEISIGTWLGDDSRLVDGGSASASSDERTPATTVKRSATA